MICRKCHHPFVAEPDGSETFCASCLQAKLTRSLGRSASIYPHGVTVRWLDNKQLALRN